METLKTQSKPFEVVVEDDDGMKVYYGSQPRQTVFHKAVIDGYEGRGPRFILYGGAAGGGKTEALLWAIFQIATDDRFSNLKIGVFRKTFPEIEKFFILRGLENYPRSEDKKEAYFIYKAKDHTMYFPRTKATVWFNYCENEVDVLRYQGAEFGVLVFDEITHHTEYVYKYLRTRHRTITPGFTPIVLATTNPGGVGHAWVKRLFIEKNAYEIGEGTIKDYVFIPAKVTDNFALIDSNPDYVDSLKALPDMDRRALLEGDWDIFAGQYFTEIRRDIHGFDPLSFGLIPMSWNRFIVLDYGFYPHPASVGWYAVDENGWLYRYKELLVQRHTTSQLAEKIIKMTTSEERMKIEFVTIPPELWAKKGTAEGKSGAEEMQDVFDKVKWMCIPADNDRVNGWYQVREYLKPFLYGEKPTARLHVALTCKGFWKQMPQLQHDPRHPEDVLKMGVSDGGKIYDGDDVGDEVRYAVMSRSSKGKSANKESKVDRYGHPIKERKRRIVFRNLPKVDYKRPKTIWDKK